MKSRSRAGMAVFVVVMVSAVIGVFVAIVIFHGRDTRRKGVEKRDRAQAYFLARGAQSHFLLKLRRLPSELYDAVSYAVGKNPYFDFSIKVAAIAGNTFSLPGSDVALFGPMFFTGSSPGNITVVNQHIDMNRSAEGDNLFQNGPAGFGGSSAENRPKMEYLLNHYAIDITSDFPVADPNGAIVTFSAEPHKEVAQFGVSDTIGSRSISNNARIDGWADPFTGSYQVREIKILGTGGLSGSGPGEDKTGKKYNTDSVMVITEASVRRDKQVSLVTRAGGSLKPLIIQRDVKTSLKQEQGWLEVKEERESDADYQRRAVSSDRTDSGRRTEICTEIYYVTREAKK